jgi:hypothetical protein
VRCVASRWAMNRTLITSLVLTMAGVAPTAAHADDADTVANSEGPPASLEPAPARPARRLSASFFAGFRLAPGRTTAEVPQGLTLGAELAYRLPNGSDLFLRSTTVGLDQSLLHASAGERAAGPEPLVELTSTLGVRRRFGRFTVESEVGVLSLHHGMGDPLHRAAMAQVGVSTRLGCLGPVCVDAGIAARATFGSDARGVAIMSTLKFSTR